MGQYPHTRRRPGYDVQTSQGLSTHLCDRAHCCPSEDTDQPVDPGWLQEATLPYGAEAPMERSNGEPPP
jgi:hypothetical protein